MNIIEAIHDGNLFRSFFRDLTSWSSWIVFLKAVFGLDLSPEELTFYSRCTGRQLSPPRQFSEILLVVGRRGGKSFIVALIGVFMACFRDYSGILAPGERGTVMIIAADRAQAGVVFRYIVAFLENVSMLAALIARKTADTIDLSNSITIEVRTASFRTVRGRTIVAAIVDEIAFLRDEASANPDAEIITALKPAMATVPGALLLMITTPYAPRGVAWDRHRRFFGVEDPDVLVWRADTRTMNPTVPQSIIDRAFEEDEVSAWSEYGRDGEIRFRSDVEGFLSREAVAAVVVPGRYELPPSFEFEYTAFTDPSGGSADSFTLAIAHEGTAGRKVLDLVREIKPPFSPEAVVSEFAADLRRYGCAEVCGDRYAGEWPRERFAAHGIRYLVSGKTKSELFLELLPRVNSGQVELLDNERMVSQFTRLERRTARSGKESVDHAPGGHDDLCNAAAGALVHTRPTQPRGKFQEFADTDFNPMTGLWKGEDDGYAG
jgi:hypothetical protein